MHRHVYPDYVGIRRLGPGGSVTGELGFLGLYTWRVFLQSPWEILVVRRKLESVTRQSPLPPASYDGKILHHVLETFPRDQYCRTRSWTSS